MTTETDATYTQTITFDQATLHEDREAHDTIGPIAFYWQGQFHHIKNYRNDNFAVFLQRQEGGPFELAQTMFGELEMRQFVAFYIGKCPAVQVVELRWED